LEKCNNLDLLSEKYLKKTTTITAMRTTTTTTTKAKTKTTTTTSVLDDLNISV
jgi:hypothetical protein